MLETCLHSEKEGPSVCSILLFSIQLSLSLGVGLIRLHVPHFIRSFSLSYSVTILLLLIQSPVNRVTQILKVIFGHSVQIITITQGVQALAFKSEKNAD